VDASLSRFGLHVGKDFIRSFGIPSNRMAQKPTQVLHLYPRLSDWIGRAMPDNVNPRSHDPECLKSPVAKKVEETIMQRPDDFYLANRGSTIIAELMSLTRRRAWSN
jgi:hypothetical protein